MHCDGVLGTNLCACHCTAAFGVARPPARPARAVISRPGRAGERRARRTAAGVKGAKRRVGLVLRSTACAHASRTCPGREAPLLRPGAAWEAQKAQFCSS